MLAKTCQENPKNWCRHIDRVQQIIYNTPPRSTKFTPFRLLTGIEMKVAEDLELTKWVKEEMITELKEERNPVRKVAKENIGKIQMENKRSFNRNRKPGENYQINDLVAIQRTQFGTGMNLRPKFLGTYVIVQVLPHGRYEVVKVGQHEGANKTVTVEEFMKEWGKSSGSEGRLWEEFRNPTDSRQVLKCDWEYEIEKTSYSYDEHGSDNVCINTLNQFSLALFNSHTA